MINYNSNTVNPRPLRIRPSKTVLSVNVLDSTPQLNIYTVTYDKQISQVGYTYTYVKAKLSLPF
jgi:hypothetical protein